MDRASIQTPTTTSPGFAHVARQSSWAAQTDATASGSPGRGVKRPADDSPMGSSQPSTRKGRACLACRKLKVKCDSLDRGPPGCTRCQRLGLDCITTKRLRISLDDDGEETHPSLARLDKAVEDILAKLKMPPLDSYSHRSQHIPESVAQTTRENSRDPPPDTEHDMAPAAMESLYEVTKLNSLRSRLKQGDPGRRSSRRKMESDLLSQNLITYEDAEQMFTLFKTTLSRYLFDATISENRSLTSVRESSSLLFTAIMVVASLHVPGKEEVYAQCHRSFLDLVAASMFDRFHTLDDIRALCIGAFWLPDLSWKLSGHCVRMATELNLHQAFYKAIYSQKQSSAEREHAFEKARLWYLLYVLDHHFSIAYGRPPVTAELQAINEYNTFLQTPQCTPSDRRVLSQVSLFLVLSKAYNVFGLEAERLMEGSDATLLIHSSFLDDLGRWRQQFVLALDRDAHVGDYPAVGVSLHYNFASMMLNSLAVRGRPMTSISTLPHSLRILALRAIESAHRILQIVLDEPSIRESLVGVPLYLHSMIAFAVVFLIKMSSRWHEIGVTIDKEKRTKPLIEDMIKCLRSCRAGRDHVLYSMAHGFERLLRQNEKYENGNRSYVRDDQRSGKSLSQQQHSDHSRQQQTQHQPLQGSMGQYMTSSMTGYSNGRDRSSIAFRNNSTSNPTSTHFDPVQAALLSPHNTTNLNTNSFIPTGPVVGGAGWQDQEDMLWSMTMGGYDLLSDTNEGFGFGYGYSGGSVGGGYTYAGGGEGATPTPTTAGASYGVAYGGGQTPVDSNGGGGSMRPGESSS